MGRYRASAIPRTARASLRLPETRSGAQPGGLVTQDREHQAPVEPLEPHERVGTATRTATRAARARVCSDCAQKWGTPHVVRRTLAAPCMPVDEDVPPQ
jgi:hypothetical protein